MTDTIFVTGLSIHARHGVMDHETEVGQRFVIDLELYTTCPSRRAATRLADTVSYADVVATTTAAFRTPITSCWSARPARWPTPSCRTSRASAP